MLKRVVRRTAEGFELEAELHHIELIIEQLGLLDVKPLSIPGVEVSAGIVHMGDFEDVEEEELAAAEATVFRAMAARCIFVKPDRPDIQYAVKERCR